MSRQIPGLVLAVLLSLTALFCRSAEIPDSLLPPMVRPVARVKLQMPLQPNVQLQWGGNASLSVFSPNGKYLAAMDAQACLQLYDAGTGKPLRQLANQGNQYATLQFSPDGKTLLATQADNSGGVILLDVATGKEIQKLDEGANETTFTTAAWSPDGTKLALAGINPHRGNQTVLTLWNALTGDEIRPLTVPAVAVPVNPGQPAMVVVESVAFSPDSKALAVLIAGQVYLLEVATGKSRGLVAVCPRHKLQLDDEQMQQQQQMMAMMMQRGRMMMQPGMFVSGCLAYSPDGRTIAVGCPDETVRLFEIIIGRELPPLLGHRGNIGAIRFSPDGTLLKTLGWDGRILVWRTDGPLRSWQPAGNKLSPEVLAALWDGLDGDDPWLSHAIQANLAAVPAQTVPFLRERLRPAAVSGSEQIAKLVAELQCDDYNRRRKAVVALKKLGDEALPALRDAQPQGSSPVLFTLLAQMEADRHVGGAEQTALAVAVLERIGNADARALLTTLSKGAAGAATTTKAKTVLDRLAKGPQTGGVVKLDALWADLGQDDPLRAYTALKTLVRHPREAVPLLRQRLRSLLFSKIDDDPRRIEKLIAELDNDDYAVREKATDELKILGKRVEKAMRQRLKSGVTPESTKRLEELLKDIAHLTPGRESFWLERGLEALELIGDAEARQTLEELVKDSTNLRAQEQIKASLQRVEALYPTNKAH